MIEANHRRDLALGRPEQVPQLERASTESDVELGGGREVCGDECGGGARGEVRLLEGGPEGLCVVVEGHLLFSFLFYKNIR